MIKEEELFKLNDLELNHFNDISVGDMLVYDIDVELKKGYFIKALCKSVKRAVQWRNKYEICGQPTTLFLFSNSYAYRNDLKKTFDQVRGLSENHLCMTGGDDKKIHFSMIKEWFVIWKWNKQLKENLKNIDERWYIIQSLFSIYMDYVEYKRYVKKHQFNIEVLVSLCDVHSVDYYFTRKFNEEKKKTVTLQHGIFSSTCNAWAYKKSASGYFLANGEFSRDEGILSGKKASELFAVGLPSFVNEFHIEEKEEFANKRMGVLLEGEYCHDDNRRLIMFMQDFCKKHNKEMYLKLHPVSRIEDYEDIIDKSICTKIYGKEISVIDFCDYIDVAIIRNSTSFLEMIMKLVPSFLFWEDGQVLEVYKNVKDLTFSTEEELLSFIKMVTEESFSKQMHIWRQYYCAGATPTENYKYVFEQIGIS